MIQNTEKLQWHPAFDAALHIELEEDLNILDIQNEYTLSKKPMQVIVTRELSEQDYYWIQNLRTDLGDREEINELLRRYEERKSSHYYQAVMDLIVRANKEKMEEERYMCDALHELIAEDVQKEVKKELEKRVEKELEKRVEKELEKVRGDIEKEVRDEVEKEVRDEVEKEAERLNALNKLLAVQNRMEDIIKAATEPEYQKKLLEEYGL